MAKQAAQKTPPEASAASADTWTDLEETASPFWHKPLTAAATLILVVIFAYGGFSVLYAGKVLPGVSANGVYLGGLKKQEAIATLEKQAKAFEGELLPIAYGETTLRISPTRFDLKYNSEAAAEAAMGVGRKGGAATKVKARLRAMLERQRLIHNYSYSDAKLTPYLQQIDNDITRPVVNAGLTFGDGAAFVSPAQAGQRLDIGRLTQLIESHLATGSTETIQAPVYAMEPLIDTSSVRAVSSSADAYLAGPITLELPGRKQTLAPPEIVNWINVGRSTPRNFAMTSDVRDMIPALGVVTVSLNKAAVADYVARLAGQVDRAPVDAALNIQDGRATVFQASRDGYKLDQEKAIAAITETLAKPKEDRTVQVAVATLKPAVSQESINNLGINELISEGVSYFPGSSADRITNVRVGSALYNGILIKPGETFSFNKYLGDVGPEQGYAPAIVILANKQEKQYGGGLCQVSSTLYRAALNAGLPITERHNHSYAVSYYTNPYPAPGVDATIYSPQLDLQFTNDTGQHILIQRVLQGTTLKFQFYGTKTKTGVIRGPFFVSGSSDATKASRTVFYRDVVDLAGKVIRTDTTYTNYKPSTDFPTVTQYN